MAIYHLSFSICSRAKGSNCVEASAYISADQFEKEELQLKTKDYSYKTESVFNKVFLPENAPKEFENPSTLWNEVERNEKSKDAQLCRKFNGALPNELTDEECIKICQEVGEYYSKQGMACQIAYHNSEGNKHMHGMLTLRGFTENGTFEPKCRKVYDLDENGQKIPLLDKNGNQKTDKNNRKQWKCHREDLHAWNDKETLKVWRKDYAAVLNNALERNKISERVTEKSFADQPDKADLIPTVHEGYFARKVYERTGVKSENMNYNLEAKRSNFLMKIMKEELKELREKVQEKIEDFKKRFTQETPSDAFKSPNSPLNTFKAENNLELFKRAYKASQSALEPSIDKIDAEKLNKYISSGKCEKELIEPLVKEKNRLDDIGFRIWKAEELEDIVYREKERIVSVNENLEKAKENLNYQKSRNFLVRDKRKIAELEDKIADLEKAKNNLFKDINHRKSDKYYMPPEGLKQLKRESVGSSNKANDLDKQIKAYKRQIKCVRQYCNCISNNELNKTQETNIKHFQNNDRSK